MQASKKKSRQYMTAAVTGVCSVAMVMALGLTGCGNSPANTSGSATSSSSASKSITAVGSTALQPLVEAAAEQYMGSNANVQVTVQGGGSGQGLTQVAQGSVQIGDSDLFAEEKITDSNQLANISDNKVCVVGMGPVVNKDVSINNISMADLKKIFTGQVTNWKQVGGQDETITVINRASGSGTRATFESAVLGDTKVPDSFKPQEQDSSGTVAKMVASTPGSISYLAFSYFSSDMKALSIDNVTPETKNVETNAWKIWAYEHMYISKAADSTTQAFVKYMLSDAVQGSLVKSNGYIPIGDMKVSRDASGKVTKL